MMGMSGFNGGLAGMNKVSLGSGIMGGLAKDINDDTFRREMGRQEGTARHGAGQDER